MEKLTPPPMAETVSFIPVILQLPQARRGTPTYMAPELLQEGGVHSFASDLWALGCVLYECFSGRPPFTSSSFSRLVSSILTEQPPPMPGTPSGTFQDLVQKLLEKDPGKRIKWDALRAHPFWRVKFKGKIQLPQQPAFESFLRGKAGGGAGGAFSPHSPPHSPPSRAALVDVRSEDLNSAGRGGGGAGGVGARGGWGRPCVCATMRMLSRTLSHIRREGGARGRGGRGREIGEEKTCVREKKERETERKGESCDWKRRGKGGTAAAAGL